MARDEILDDMATILSRLRGTAETIGDEVAHQNIDIEAIGDELNTNQDGLDIVIHKTKLLSKKNFPTMACAVALAAVIVVELVLLIWTI